MRTIHTLAPFAFVVLSASATRAGNDPAEDTPPVPPTATPTPHEKPTTTPAPTGPSTPADAALLAAMLQLEHALGDGDPQKRPVEVGDAIRALSALKDARAVPALLRLSRSSEQSLRLTALSALMPFLEDKSVRDRLE